MTGLSTRDTRVLDYLRQTVTDTHCPTFQQIGDACGLASKSQVSASICNLRNCGWIRHQTYGRRNIELIDPYSSKSTAELRAMRDRIDRVLAGRAK